MGAILEPAVGFLGSISVSVRNGKKASSRRTGCLLEEQAEQYELCLHVVVLLTYANVVNAISISPCPCGHDHDHDHGHPFPFRPFRPLDRRRAHVPLREQVAQVGLREAFLW